MPVYLHSSAIRSASHPSEARFAPPVCAAHMHVPVLLLQPTAAAPPPPSSSICQPPPPAALPQRMSAIWRHLESFGSIFKPQRSVALLCQATAVLVGCSCCSGGGGGGCQPRLQRQHAVMPAAPCAPQHSGNGGTTHPQLPRLAAYSMLGPVAPAWGGSSIAAEAWCRREWRSDTSLPHTYRCRWASTCAPVQDLMWLHAVYACCVCSTCIAYGRYAALRGFCFRGPTG